MAQNNTLTIGEFCKECLSKWKWFCYSVVVFMLLAIIYLVVTPPKYTKKAQVLIKEGSGMGAMMSQLGGLAELGGLVGLNLGSTNVYNELYAMQSPWLLLNVVHQLHLDMSYTIEGIRNKDLYAEAQPIIVDFKDITEEDDVRMKVDLSKNGNVRIYKFKKNDDKYDDDLTGKVGQTFKTSIGQVEIKATPYLSNMKDDEVTITAERTGDTRSSQMSAVVMPVEKLKSVPVMFGEADLIKALQLMPGVQVFEHACPLFVPLVENGVIDRNDVVTQAVAARYLQPLKEQGVDTLILGCTHFPILRGAISDYMGEGVTLIDSGLETAVYAAKVLREQDLLSDDETVQTPEFYVSDTPEGFKNVAGLFLGRDMEHTVTQIDIEQYRNVKEGIGEPIKKVTDQLQDMDYSEFADTLAAAIDAIGEAFEQAANELEY